MDFYFENGDASVHRGVLWSSPSLMSMRQRRLEPGLNWSSGGEATVTKRTALSGDGMGGHAVAKICNGRHRRLIHRNRHAKCGGAVRAEGNRAVRLIARYSAPRYAIKDFTSAISLIPHSWTQLTQQHGLDFGPIAMEPKVRCRWRPDCVARSVGLYQT